MIDIDDAWDNFLEDGYIENELTQNKLSENNENNNFTPKVTDIYISTKTKIAYLNLPIDLNTVFWKINFIS